MASHPNTHRRSPVIVVLGHVDHGKTTLLDAIRKTSVAAKEAGGITQSIGAYEIAYAPTHADDTQTNADSKNSQRVSASSPRQSAASRRMTFIDTPGHEAFSKMRSRGAGVADVAILVVAIDDSVQTQTKEAIEVIRAAKIPFVVALTKADKGVDISKVKNDLTAAGVLLEGYGGTVSFQVVSAKTGEGISDLLDLLALSADVADLSTDPTKPGEGVILEAKRDGRRGIVATGIIKDGTVHVGDLIAASSAGGKVRGLEDFAGGRLKEASASTPVLIIGFEALPAIGERFMTGAGTKASATNAPGSPKANRLNIRPTAGSTESTHEVKIILKADVSGSLETLASIMDHLKRPAGTALTIIETGIGDITDGDVKLATSTGAAIVGFRIGTTKAASALAQAHSIKIIASEIIYELTKAIEDDLKTLDKTIIKADLEILKIFGNQGPTKQIVGGKVVAGPFMGHATVEIIRRGAAAGTAKVINLQCARKDAGEVAAGAECGLLLDASAPVKEGDHLIVR
mgnify:CR=1 FL=1